MEELAELVDLLKKMSKNMEDMASAMVGLNRRITALEEAEKKKFD